MVTNRLSKILAEAGVASRRASEKLIFDGKVKVNGQIVLIPQTSVTLGKDKILVNDKPIKNRPSKLYFILNKPAGYVCSNSKLGKEKIIFDLFSEDLPRLFTVGRLDKDTTGLLIVTNDGQFANRIIHPSNNIQKEYLVKVDHEITDDHLKELMRGAVVEGVHVSPVRVTKVRKGTIKIVVKEGKKREVRELLAVCGLSVIELTRIRIGSLTLGNMAVGAIREMSEKEKELIINERKTQNTDT